MLTLEAQVMNIFKAPTGKTRDGETFGGEYKVQLQGKNELRNGETRMELFTLTTRNPSNFQDQIGKTVKVKVGAFPNGRAVQFFLIERQ